MAKRKVIAKPLIKKEPAPIVEPEPAKVGEVIEVKPEVKVEIPPTPPPSQEPPPVLLSSLKPGTDFDLDGIHYRVKAIDLKANLTRVAILEWAQTPNKVKIEKYTVCMPSNTKVK